MCFGSKDGTNEPGPKPASAPQQQQTSASAPPPQSSTKKAAPTSSYPPPNQSSMAGPSNGADYAAPSGPPPSKAQEAAGYEAPSGPPPSKRAQEYDAPSGPPPSHGTDGYAAPSGPPPSHARVDEYAAPSGPPPSKHADDFAPPSGPPPGARSAYDDDFAPPAGPPPPSTGADDKKNKDPSHDWEAAVPDTSLLPPPPAFFAGFDRSPANNATEEEAEAGERWVREFPLWDPMQPDKAAVEAAGTGNANLIAPPFFKGALAQTGVGAWKLLSRAGARDTCIASYPPLYSVAAHSPLATGRARTIYYEVNILSEGSRGEVSLALGFVAPPYPPFRLPGWHRGSLGVHGDDGHRYVNDRWGGKPFTAPFKRGETVGLGMEIKPAQGGGLEVEVFMTREGAETGRWGLHEETDKEQDLPVTGLEGFHDLCAAVGCFDKVACEIVFVPARWKWRGYQG